MKNKSNRLKQILFTTATMWLLAFQVNGQVVSYPWLPYYYNVSNATTLHVTFDANTFTVNEGDKYYADEDRAEIVNCYVSGHGYNITLTNNSSHRHGRFKNLTGVDSMSNETRRFLIIQNKSASVDAYGNWTTGNCAELLIDTCSDSSGFIIAHLDNMSGSIDYFEKDILNGAIMQIVRVPIFKTLELHGGVITCHAFDGHTGGLLPIRTQILNCHSGFFDAAAKGYGPESITWGTPSNGAAGDNTYTPITQLSQYKDTWAICPNTLGLTLVQGNYGYAGDSKVTISTAGTGTTGSKVKYGITHTIPFVRPIMGEAGYFKVGQTAGNGAEGGGHGGVGGSSNNGSSGSPGGNGGNGGNGGAVGKGARGGGIIMLRVEAMYYITGNHFTSPLTYPDARLFYINGENGQFGENGGNGGDGGNYGWGATGSSVGNTVYWSGGNGAPGEPGFGGTGGDGSTGGTPGFLGLFLKNFYPVWSNSYSHLLSVTNSKPGAPGSGGQGGFTGSAKTFSATSSFTLPVGKTYCGGGGGSPPMRHICNCDSVFWAMSSSATLTTPSGSPTHYSFTDYDAYVKYDTGEVHLWSLYKAGNVTSHCYLLSDTLCMPMFEKMKGISNLTAYWGTIDLTTYPAQRISSSPLVVTFNKSALPYSVALQWVGSDGVLYDEMEPGKPMCYKGNCDSEDSSNRTRQPDGEKDNYGDNAILDESSMVDEKNVGLFESFPEMAYPFPLNKYRPELIGKIKPFISTSVAQNISSLDIVIPDQTVQDVEYIIINALGQTIRSGKTVQNPVRQIFTNGLSSGVYNLILYNQNGNFVYKFVIIN